MLMLSTPLPYAKHLDQGGEMLLVSWARVEPGEIQSIKAMGPQKWGNRFDESPASLRVGGNPGKSRTKPPQNELGTPMPGTLSLQWDFPGLGAGGLKCQI